MDYMKSGAQTGLSTERAAELRPGVLAPPVPVCPQAPPRARPAHAEDGRRGGNENRNKTRAICPTDSGSWATEKVQCGRREERVSA